jgi:hypothetical protein
MKKAAVVYFVISGLAVAGSLLAFAYNPHNFAVQLSLVFSMIIFTGSVLVWEFVFNRI